MIRKAIQLVLLLMLTTAQSSVQQASETAEVQSGSDGDEIVVIAPSFVAKLSDPVPAAAQTKKPKSVQNGRTQSKTSDVQSKTVSNVDKKYHFPTGIPATRSLVNASNAVISTKAEGKSDAKVDVATPSRMREILRGGKGKGGKGRGLAPVTVWLVVDVDIASGANAVYNTAFPVYATSGTDYSSWAALYDEYKTHGFKFVFKNILTGTPSDAGQLAVFAWDPLNDTALGGTAFGCDHTHHKLWGQSFATSTQVAIPTAVTPTGLMEWNVRFPKGMQFGTAGEFVGGWASTEIAVASGYVKPYLEAVGGTGVSNVRGMLYIQTTFRSRG